MKLGTYAKTDDGFNIELISGNCEYAVGTTEAHMMTLRMGVEGEGLIMFLDIDDMQDFANQMRKCVDQLRMDLINDYLKKSFGSEFEF